jgi:isoquinoline 1-oxidoreductase beta subunit
MIASRDNVAGINEAPGIDVHLVSGTPAPGGIGEPGMAAIAPAVADAIFG